MQHLVQAFYQGYRKLIRHHRYRWFVIGATLLYWFSPIDLAPDIIPVIGWIDDGLLATLLITEITQMVTERIRKHPQAGTNPEQPDNGPVIDVMAQ
ncbi:MAG: YkvA family protein [Cyanobacteria bacterium]|nr:YkvA family protein [Cyanobacteriota bacterium]